MFRRLGFLVRADERRHVAAAFGFLMVFVASHAVLETARDALFLTKIPSDHLPFVYMAIALVTFGVTRLQLSQPAGEPRREMARWTAFGGAGSILLGALLPLLGSGGLYVLYVWPGVVATLTLVHFWSLLGGFFTATQAKRLFGIVSLGSMIGAIAGSGGMTIALRYASPRALVIVSGISLVAVSAVPMLLFRGAESTPRRTPGERSDHGLAGFAYVLRGAYARRLVTVALFASATLTFADYVFKSTIVDAIPKETLPQALGAIYTGLNALSLIVQLAGVGFVLRKLAPPVILAVLPALLVVSGTGVAATGVLAAALAVKATDGALRHSLHKTAMELLVVPLSDSVRRTVKSAMDVVGQRGGQVLASAAILLAEAVGLGRTISWVLTGSALAWAALSIRLRPLYVEQFRRPVTDSRAFARHVHAPKLDVASLETLIAALDSESNDEVLAALGILERERKAHLVPTLILYHPDEDVVVAALRLFSRTRRNGALHAIDTVLTKHQSYRMRAEAYAARAAIAPDAAFLKQAYADETSCEGRAAIAAVLATELDDTGEARRMLEEVLEDASISTRVVICEVLGWRRAAQFIDVLEVLATAPELEVKKAAIHALGDLASTRAATMLVELLGEEPIQRSARQALARTGDVGLGALEAALRDRQRPSGVRWAVPGAMALLDYQRAAPMLLANLREEPDGMVRFRSIVTLGNILERHPKLHLDRKLIDEEIRINVSRAYRYLDRRLVLEEGGREDQARKRPGHQLLVDLLRDKQRSAVGRIFRLLSLAFPQHRFVDIYLAIESGERGFRASAVELTHNLLRSPLRDGVVGLVDEIDDDARLGFSDGYHEPLERSYEALLKTLLRSSSAIVRDIAAFHVAELGLADLAEDLAALGGEGKGSSDVDRALDILGGRPPPSVGLAAAIAPVPARAG